MEPTSLPESPEAATAERQQPTRRAFIRGIAAAGASTAAAVALERTGFLNLETDAALAATPNDFSTFNAIAASPADAFEVPEGFRADVLISYGDTFEDDQGNTLTFGYNNDFIAFFPLPFGSENSDEGLLFVNHEYPAPYFLSGQTNPSTKTVEAIEEEQQVVGNSVLHIKRNSKGLFEVVSPSKYNRRITGESPVALFTGPLAGNPAYPGIGLSANGSLANCSGGITPWGTALSCEENYQDYAATTAFGYGWTNAKIGTTDYENGDGTTTGSPSGAGGPGGPAKYGWVVETDPYDKTTPLRKHTALGRFRHENTAFRVQNGKRFVLYMGDDIANGGVYKFVSDHAYIPGNDANNSRILSEGTLYIAYWDPEGRRRFSDTAGTVQVTPANGSGYWREVTDDQLVDTNVRIRTAVGAAEFTAHYATNRPEDLEVDESGSVFIALTNNSGVNDLHGSVRRLIEHRNDPEAVGDTRRFIWDEYAAGGPTGRADEGERGFSSPDNLVFDNGGNVWVVTDISSTSLNNPSGTAGNYLYHGNNALFMVPRTGANAGVAFRFANMPVGSEGTGPYFTPDEQTLFVDVQHPGENSPEPPQESSWTSYWPGSSKTAGGAVAEPLPSLVQITRVRPDSPGSPVIPPPPAGDSGTPPRPDATKPRITLVSPGRASLSRLRAGRYTFKIAADEGVSLQVTLRGRLTSAQVRKRKRKASDAVARGKTRRLARTNTRLERAGEVTVRLRPSSALRLLLRREKTLPALLQVKARDAAGNVTTRTKNMRFR